MSTERLHTNTRSNRTEIPEKGPAPKDLSAFQGGVGAGSTTFIRRAPSERIRTASEIPFEVDLKDEDAVPVYMRIAEKVYISAGWG